MQKRHYRLSIAIAIEYLIQQFNFIMIIIIYGGYGKQSTVGAIFFWLAAVNATTVSYIQFFKMWVHYFDIKFNSKELAKQWKAVINPESVDTFDNNWFFRNRQTYGNPKYLIKRLVIIAIVMLIFIIIAEIIIGYNPEKQSHINIITTINTLVLMIVSGTPIIMTIYIGCKIPSFHDNFHIKKEAKYLMILVVTTNIVVILHVGGLYVYPKGARQAAILIFWLFVSIIAFCISILVTLWAVRKNWLSLTNITRESIAQSSYKLKIVLENVESNSPSYKPNIAKKLPSESVPPLHGVTMRLEDLIKCKYGFQLLNTHLSHEFSMELILSLIEMIQYKQAIYDYIFSEECSVNVEENEEQNWDISNSIDFGEMVPRSKIVYGQLSEEYSQVLKRFGNDDQCQEKIADFKLRGYQLFKKYVIIGSKYEINIAYLVRKRFSELMGNVDSWMENDLNENSGDDKQGLLFLFKLFDQAMDETRGLLQFSFSRLKTSAAYRQYVATNKDTPSP